MTAMRPASRRELLERLEPSERVYIDTTIEDYLAEHKRLTSCAARRDVWKAGQQFTVSAFTAVGSQRVGETRILLCVERTA